MLDDLDSISFQCIQADELPVEEKTTVIKELRKGNPKCSFPAIVVDDEVIVRKFPNEGPRSFTILNSP